MNSEIILYLLIGIITADFILEFVLSFLNLYHQKDSLPKEVADIYDEANFKKAQDYLRVCTRFEWLTSTFSFALIITVLLTEAFGWLDGLLLFTFETPMLRSLAFLGILFIASDILSMPFSLYKTFRIEASFGFNKTSLSTFFLDKLKGYVLGILVGGLLLSCLLWLIQLLGQNFWIVFWAVATVFILGINTLYTSLILPLFNKLTPLESGDLRNAIERYSKKVEFPLTNVFVMDGSKRSSKSNAFFSGLGKNKKIVLYDTLIQNHSQDELVAVLAHEAGHYKKNHILLGMVLSILQTGGILFLLSLFVFNRDLSLAMGGGENAIHLNLIAFMILFSPISHVLGMIGNYISRKNEYEADAYAKETFGGEALITALKKLSSDNLSNLTPHPAMVLVHYSHPPLVERIKSIQNN